MIHHARRRQPKFARIIPSPQPHAIEMAVVVTCHAAYLGYLPETLASIDSQSKQPSAKILVLDGCDYSAPEGWTVLTGDWKNPNPARNLGWRSALSDWYVFWDGDDVMPADFISRVIGLAKKAPRNVGVLYHTVHYDGNPTAHNSRPWSYWALRKNNWVSTQSAWRRDALMSVGGWDDHSEVRDDWNLALRLSRSGWIGAPTDIVISLRLHADVPHRHKPADSPSTMRSIWRSRSLAVVTLLAGRRHCLPAWLDWLAKEELPPRSRLYLVDNSGDADFGRDVRDAAHSLRERFELVEVATVPGSVDHLHRHAVQRGRHIANLYNDLFVRLREDMVLTIEDDVIPPAGAVKALAEHFAPNSSVGAAAGIYQSAFCSERICGTTRMDRYADNNAWGDFPAAPVTAGYIPGGCTLYANWALQKGLPLRITETNGKVQSGWDIPLSEAMRESGFELILDGRVRCIHTAAV